MVYKRIRQGLIALLHRGLPYTCVLCGGDGDEACDLCSACRADFPYITTACQHCGQSLPAGCLADAAVSLVCGQCLKKPPLYQKAISLCAYEPPISWLIQGLKFNGKLQYGRLMAKLMLDHLGRNWAGIVRPELIIPVPLHPNRLRSRGFNQAMELALPIAEGLTIPLDANSCVRVLDTPPQSDLPAKKRKANVRKAFALVGNISAKNIAIVDDVMTTGATVNELAKLLLRNGAQSVQVWVMARTQRSLTKSR